MIRIDLHSRTPIYEQIKEQTISLIRLGIYSTDEKLPSIRALATQLNLNVNTVKRAFQELEKDGVTYSLPGRGVFVSKGAIDNQKVQMDTMADVELCLRSAIAKGVSRENLDELIKNLYENR